MEFSLNERLKCLRKYFGNGTLTANQKNFDVWCPYCNDRRKEKRKLSINVTNSLWQCWVCGNSGRHIAFVVRKFGLGDLQDLLKVYPDNRLKKNDEKVRIARPKLPEDFQLLVTSKKETPDVLALRRYCKARGLSEDDLWRYRIGYSSDFRWSRRVIVPSFDASGELNYYTGRAVDSSSTRRYETVEVEKLDVVFNEIDIDWKRPLVICEGPFDVMKCGDNATPLLGSNINENSRLFFNIVVNKTPVALALDDDMREKTMKIVKKFEEYDVPVTVVDLGKHKDPGEMTKKQFESSLKNATELDWNTRIMEMLKKAKKVSTRV